MVIRKYAQEWITLRRRKVLCTQLAKALDEGIVYVDIAREYDAESRYYSMIYPLKVMLNQYRLGEDRISDTFVDFFKYHGVTMPQNRSFPECIEEVMLQIESEIPVHFNAILKDAKERTAKEMEKREREKDDLEKKYQQVEELLLDCCGLTKVPDNSFLPNKISVLCKLQSEKAQDKKYQLTMLETEAFEIYVSLLTRLIVNPYITVAQMKILVDSGWVRDGDFTGMLKSAGDQRDYEWYEEDMMKQSISSATIFPVEKILDYIEADLKKEMGIRP